jgi:hypothetical protein
MIIKAYLRPCKTKSGKSVIRIFGLLVEGGDEFTHSTGLIAGEINFVEFSYVDRTIEDDAKSDGLLQELL